MSVSYVSLCEAKNGDIVECLDGTLWKRLGDLWEALTSDLGVEDSREIAKRDPWKLYAPYRS